MLRSLALGARRTDRIGGWSAPGRSNVWLIERRQLRQDHCWAATAPHGPAATLRAKESEGERRSAFGVQRAAFSLPISTKANKARPEAEGESLNVVGPSQEVLCCH